MTYIIIDFISLCNLLIDIRIDRVSFLIVCMLTISTGQFILIVAPNVIIRGLVPSYLMVSSSEDAMDLMKSRTFVHSYSDTPP